jgi:hypothetical protein
MKSRLLLLALLLVALQPNLAPANVVHVPEQYATIQGGIGAAQTGDTVSVWGPPPGQPPVPPWTYYENVNFGGRIIFVVNRSFLPYEEPLYDSSWEHVIIDGSNTAPVVKMDGGSNSVLKGFTIQHGAYLWGGGVVCFGGQIIKNHIWLNSASVGGGGVIVSVHSAGPSAAIYDNLVEENSCNTGRGGGLSVQSGGMDVDIRRNIIRHNSAMNWGGGIFFSLIPDLPGLPTWIERFSDNLIDGNSLSDPDSFRGGGIYDFGWPFAARRNIITNNTPNGVYVDEVNPDIGHLDFGSPADPGFNVMMNNGTRDYVANVRPIGLPIQVAGSYWGSINTSSIMSRVVPPPLPRPFYFDPVAASSKWFDVNRPEGSLCETGVLVTGDLRVSRSLTIQPGKKLEFSLDPDMSLAGGDPGRTDLIVEGQGTVLTSFGTEADTIHYTSRRNMEPSMPGDWYGIRVRNGAKALFVWSEIGAAYCGISVEPGGLAQTRWSKLHACLFAGADVRQGSVWVQESEVSDNEVYGVHCEIPPPGDGKWWVTGSTLNHNGFAGVSFTGAVPTDAPHRITDNVIAAGIGGPFPAMYGVEVRGASTFASVENNQVSGFHQAGIALWASSPSMMLDVALGNTVNGIACFEGSHPAVRWATVDMSQNGVFCDASSFPDLGTEENPGNNSILFGNVVWVNRVPLSAESVQARLNWWGVDNPNAYPEKFFGNIAYAPWLSSPPGDGGGQQSAGPESSLLKTALGQPLPMPMTGTTRIPFQVAHVGPVSLDVVDASGRVVRVLVRGERTPGRYKVTWDRLDDRGRRMPEGVYFLRFDAGTRRDVQKVVVMR